MNEARQHPRLEKSFTLTRAPHQAATTVNSPRMLEQTPFAQARNTLGRAQ
jgi:hypothetical protein